MADLHWSFWIPFDGAWNEDGWVGITVDAEGIDDAIDMANSLAAQTVELLDADGGNVGIFFATDYPFDRNTLATVECFMDGERIDRLSEETLDDFLSRLKEFVARHPDDGHDSCQCGDDCTACSIGLHATCRVACDPDYAASLSPRRD